MLKKFILKNERSIIRFLEILPGFVSWNLILFPYWGILIIPEIVAYFILAYNLYWFYQSLSVTFTLILSHLRISASMKYDWLKDLESFPDWQKVHHLVVITTYKEPLHTLQKTLYSLSRQTLPKKQISIVLATEEAETKEEREKKAYELKKQFGKIFANFFITVHKLSPGEVKGKASNERFATIWAKKELVDKQKYDIRYITVTSCDADHRYHPNHFAALTYKFLDNPKRYFYFWQPAILFYNNIWDLPAITRVPNTLMSIWNLSQISRKDRLINAQNYSTSLKLLDEIDYWDPDKIPEDWGVFFKAYYKKGGEVEVEPIYLPVYADAAQSTSFLKTIKNQYEQIKRWAWGASDDPWIIKNYFLTPEIPFLKKTMRLITVIWAHFLWPVNWFIITIGLNLPTLLNKSFGRTTLGYTVPKFSSLILTISLLFLGIMLIFDFLYKPQRPKNFPLWRLALIPFEFILMPLTGFIFNALPGIDAHTRLMLGKYIEYKVTEKV